MPRSAPRSIASPADTKSKYSPSMPAAAGTSPGSALDAVADKTAAHSRPPPRQPCASRLQKNNPPPPPETSDSTFATAAPPAGTAYPDGSNDSPPAHKNHPPASSPVHRFQVDGKASTIPAKRSPPHAATHHTPCSARAAIG